MLRCMSFLTRASAAGLEFSARDLGYPRRRRGHPPVRRTRGSGDLPAAFAVSDLAAATIASAGLAVSELVAVSNGLASVQSVQVDRRLASFWFGTSLQPQGWSMPPVWDPLAGDYATVDGWIRLHTNAPHHREAALAVVGEASDKARVVAAVSQWRADELERAVVNRGGCAAAMRPLDAWREHPQGRSVAGEPLLWWV